MQHNSDLVDFERGSTFGGILTAFLFTGFISILLYDLAQNVRNKPYSFIVQDKFMTPEEHVATRVSLADFESSQEIVVGFQSYFENGTQDVQFNPLDNDYIEVTTANWDTGLNIKEGKPWVYVREGPGLQICSKEKLSKVMAEGEMHLKKNFLCFKNKNDTYTYG